MRTCFGVLKTNLAIPARARATLNCTCAPAARPHPDPDPEPHIHPQRRSDTETQTQTQTRTPTHADEETTESLELFGRMLTADLVGRHLWQVRAPTQMGKTCPARNYCDTDTNLARRIVPCPPIALSRASAKSAMLQSLCEAWRASPPHFGAPAVEHLFDHFAHKLGGHWRDTAACTQQLRQGMSSEFFSESMLRWRGSCT